MQRHWNGQTENHPTIEGSLLSTFSTGVRHAFDRASKLFVPYPSGLTDARGNAIPANRGWLYDSLSYQGFAPEFADGFSYFINRDTFDHDTYRANLGQGRKGTRPELPETLDFEYRKRPIGAAHVEGVIAPIGDTFTIFYRDAYGPGIHRKIFFGWQRFSDLVMIEADPGKDLDFDFEINTGGLNADGSKRQGFDWIGKLKDGRKVRWDRLTSQSFDDGFELEERGTGKRSFIRPDSIPLKSGLQTKVSVALLAAGQSRRLRKSLPAGALSMAQYPLEIGTVSSFFSGAGDGSVSNTGSVFLDVRNSAVGNSSNSVSPFVLIETTWSSPIFTVRRLFFPVDSSSLGSSATISSANFSVVAGSTIFSGDGMSVGVVSPTTQASTSSLSNSDYSATAGSEFASRKLISSFSLDVISTFAITNLTSVSKTGFSMLGMRVSGDIDSVEPVNQNILQLNMSEQSGTSQDPVLNVTYTVPSFIATDLAGGMQQMTGGMNG